MPKTANKTTSTKAFVNGAAACRVAGVNRAELARLAMLGRVRTLAEPGQFIRFNVEDCERIAATK